MSSVLSGLKPMHVTFCGCLDRLLGSCIIDDLHKDQSDLKIKTRYHFVCEMLKVVL